MNELHNNSGFRVDGGSKSTDSGNSTPPPVPKNIRAQYIYGVRDRNDLIFRDYSPDGIVDTARHYVLSDAMLSTTAIADTTGEIQQRFRYTAFGTVTNMTPDFIDIPTNPNNWQVLLHGEYYDEDTQWSNYGYRYYVANNGRWIMRELLAEPADTNLYRYTMNNATSAFDMYGLEIPGFKVPALPELFSPEFYPELFIGTRIYNLDYYVYCDCLNNYVGSHFDFLGTSEGPETWSGGMPKYEMPKPVHNYIYIYKMKFTIDIETCETPQTKIWYLVLKKTDNISVGIGAGGPIGHTGKSLFEVLSGNVCVTVTF
jgi:RHS repeat-associated protein